MSRVEVGRYENPVGWKGWICTDAWITFERDDDALVSYRRGDDGAVIGEPVVLPAMEN